MAIPLDSVLVPRVVTPSINVTVPVAVDGVTVAVKATELLKVDGLGDDVMPVVVDAWLTVKVLEAELAPKIPCAEYSASKL